MPGEKILKINGVDICAESFGDRNDPAALLIMGAMASMIWWDEEFCKRLAERGRYVIRYDNRDVGRSTAYEPGTINYDIADMAEDAVGVLAALGIERAHFIGMSLGGMISQIVALKYPEKVLSLSFIASGGLFSDPELPSINQNVLDYHSKGSGIDWSDRSETVEFMVGGWRLLSGSGRKFIDGEARKLAETEFDRANNLQSMFNHAQLKGGEEYTDRMNEIKSPTLIIHGTDDPVLPYQHALALKKAIRNSRLVTLDGVGHEIHRDDWDRIVEELIAVSWGKDEIRLSD